MLQRALLIHLKRRVQVQKRLAALLYFLDTHSLWRQGRRVKATYLRNSGTFLYTQISKCSQMYSLIDSCDQNPTG